MGKRFFSYRKRSDRLWGPPSLLLNAYQCFLLRLKWPAREVDHAPPSSADFEYEWSCISPICLHGVGQTQHHFHLYIFSPLTILAEAQNADLQRRQSG
jgi:hypothetical protein